MMKFWTRRSWLGLWDILGQELVCLFIFSFQKPSINHFAAYNQGDKARVIQTLLFVAGINTLLQALFGTRLPAVVGGSFAYVIPIAYIISDSSLQRIIDPHEVSYFLSNTYQKEIFISLPLLSIFPFFLLDGILIIT